MMFLFAVPMIDIGVYLVPLMIGTRDMALPRFNAFAYWVLIGAVTLYTAFLLGVAPNSGWFNYPPLSERAESAAIGSHRTPAASPGASPSVSRPPARSTAAAPTSTAPGPPPSSSPASVARAK